MGVRVREKEVPAPVITAPTPGAELAAPLPHPASCGRGTESRSA
jgi:hypothetical protein